MSTKHMIAAGAAGAVLAAGALVAVELGTSDAEAATTASLQSQINTLDTKLAAEQERTVAALKRACEIWNGGGNYTSPSGTKPPGNKSPKCTQQVAQGGGWQAEELDDPWWVKNYYDGAVNNYTGKGVTGVTRTAVGEYRVEWSKNISMCAYTVTPGYYKGGEPDKYAMAQVYNGTAANNVIVKTYSAGAAGADVTAMDYPWQGQITCHSPTKTSP